MDAIDPPDAYGHRPVWRGRVHLLAALAATPAALALFLHASGPLARVAVTIYAATLVGLFAVSASYHRLAHTPTAVKWFRRADHSMIFLLIAGTVTPFALLNMTGTWSTAILVAVWSAAIVGIIVELLWIHSPKWVSAAMYVAVGWIGAVAFPQIVGTAGVWAGLLIATGGILYTVGAVVYATGRPNPSPTYFGYHEVFHLFVIGAAALHFAAVAMFAL